ncbi:hypothetical protein GY45DRAFT_208823 [Cubamyces sp. BRFM 1775]|nr:hypothetical protein GY45DRAFT_208823 [Cubamyces sp. BRFM 1775]
MRNSLPFQANCMKLDGSRTAVSLERLPLLLNLNVLDQIMLLLPDKALGALRSTCWFFADVTFRPLSRRSCCDFRSVKNLCSFMQVHRVDSPHPRAQHICELDFDTELELAYKGTDAASLFRYVLRIMDICPPRRCIDLNLSAVRDSLKDLSRIISPLHHMGDLSMQLRYPVTEGNLRASFVLVSASTQFCAITVVWTTFPCGFFRTVWKNLVCLHLSTYGQRPPHIPYLASIPCGFRIQTRRC